MMGKISDNAPHACTQKEREKQARFVFDWRQDLSAEPMKWEQSQLSDQASACLAHGSSQNFWCVEIKFKANGDSTHPFPVKY